MKRALVVALFAVVMLMAFTSSAFALHGAYNSTGASCSECHSVHDATGGTSQNLFVTPETHSNNQFALATGATGGPGLTPSGAYTNDNTEHLCEYCHVYGGHNIAQVYGAGLQGNSSTMAAHKIGALVIPSSDGSVVLKGNGTAGGLGCVDCHNALPHAAKSGKNWSTSNSTVRIADPAGSLQNMYSQDVVTAAYGNQAVNAFCARCHNKNMELNLGGTTHVLTTSTTMNTTNYGSVQVAWNGSETCVKCHNVKEFHALQAVAGQTILTAGSTAASGTITGTKPFQYSTIEATGTAFTAFGPGIDRFNAATSEIADGICLSCHMDPTASPTNPSAGGVGVTF